VRSRPELKGWRFLKHLFIINPAAGKYDRSHEVLEKLITLTDGLELNWDYVLTERPWHGAELARAAAEKGEPVRIYACGGDGTLNEVVNGAAGFPNAAVTHYPTGSGNDFIKIFGPDAPLFYDLHELLGGEEAALDLMDCNGRLAVNICSLGFDARVGMGMADFKRYPLVSGPMAYQLSLIKNVIAGIHRPYRIDLDGETFDGDYTLMAACNGRYYGGGFNPAPAAMPDDGILDFVVVRAVSRFTVAAAVKQYAGGGAEGLGDFIKMRRGRSLRVECDRMSMVNVDGERMDAISLSIALSAKKINFIYPRGAHWDPARRRREYENASK
jgi:YegS/Rv2252/BmrU family lipid kinase